MKIYPISWEDNGPDLRQGFFEVECEGKVYEYRVEIWDRTKDTSVNVGYSSVWEFKLDRRSTDVTIYSTLMQYKKAVPPDEAKSDCQHHLTHVLNLISWDLEFEDYRLGEFEYEQC
jgi:hypothetical protein